MLKYVLFCVFSGCWECARVTVVSLIPSAEGRVRAFPPSNSSVLESGKHFSIKK